MKEAQKVIIVDDDPGTADILVRMVLDSLGEENVEVLVAYSSADALTLIEDNPGAILVTDLMMPGMNGIELARAARIRYPDHRALGITAFPRDCLPERPNGEFTEVFDKTDANRMISMLGLMVASGIAKKACRLAEELQFCFSGLRPLAE